jgi:hypothetical protein
MVVKTAIGAEAPGRFYRWTYLQPLRTLTNAHNMLETICPLGEETAVTLIDVLRMMGSLLPNNPMQDVQRVLQTP